MMTALFCVAWGMVTLFFVSVVRAGAKPVPTPEGKSLWANDLKTTRRVPLRSGSTLVLNSRLSNSR
jgi:hypothetical protein